MRQKVFTAWWTLASWAVAVPGLLVLAAAPAGAEEAGEAGRRVRFSVESSRAVPNDRVRAVVGVTAEDVDSTTLADTVNRTMAWALERARAESRVTATSGTYHTHPVHDQGRLRRWRAGQTLVLEGGDTEAMTALVGALQERLQLQSFDFSVSRETRDRVEAELVTEVLAAFRSRADLVRKGLGAKGYAIDEVSIGTGGPSPIRHVRMEALASAAPAPPAVEEGVTRLVVTANGTIVLE